MISSVLARTIAVFVLTLSATAPAAATEPKVFGQLHEIMMMGKSVPNVKLSALPGKNVFAVGALSGLRGEVTILDGAIWLSYGSEDGSIKVERPRTSDESATLLVYSQVQRWQRLELTSDVPFAELDPTIERLAKANGIDVSKPFPVRVEGELTALRWHSLRGASPPPGGHAHHDHAQLVVTKTHAKVKGQLVGFFSTRHHGVFTHMGENTHFHVILQAEKQMGHVDAVSLCAGATLLLPR